LVLSPLLGGCDRQSGADKQPVAATSSAANAAESASAGETTGIADRSHKGSLLPDLTFHDGTGKVLRTSELKGKPVLINLWATWCGPCVAEMPKLDALAAKGAIRVVTISQDSGAAEKVAAFLKARSVKNLEPWLDPDGIAAGQWQVSTLPASIYYDANGREIWRMNGGMDWTGAQAGQLLAEK
jgi:thiol-disulfide isomerase/thioredoxin